MRLGTAPSPPWKRGVVQGSSDENGGCVGARIGEGATGTPLVLRKIAGDMEEVLVWIASKSSVGIGSAFCDAKEATCSTDRSRRNVSLFHINI